MDRQGQWDTSAEQSKYGLTLADIQIGDYGDPPAESDNQTGRPRGATPRPGSYRIGNYAIRTKSEIWLDNASFLYEEALQRQWSSATDIPWHTIEPLPDGHRAGSVHHGHVPDGGRVRGGGRAGAVDRADDPGLLRGPQRAAVPGDGTSRATWMCSASGRWRTAAGS